MEKGILFINYKLYPQAAGVKGVELTRRIAAVASEYPDVQVAVSPQVLDIREVADSGLKLTARQGDAEIEIWAQHCDAASEGRGTGYITPAGLKEDGADGVFLNHSEHPFQRFGDLQKAVEMCKKNSLSVLIFSPDINHLKKVLAFPADFYAIEPPELIASKDSSISDSQPSLISKSVEIVPSGTLIVGAGIKSKKDVEIALQLGACGVAVASDIVKAEDPKQEIRELLEGFG